MTVGDGEIDLNAELAQAQQNPVLVEAALALQRNDLGVAERLLKDSLRARPMDVAALRMLAELAARLGRLEDAQDLLERTLAIAPDFVAARLNYATILHRRNRLRDALAQLETILLADSTNPPAQALKAAVLARAGNYAEAVSLYQEILARHPDQSRLWMSLGHALKTMGRQRESITAYRRALALAPGLGEAWWSLANLKTLTFESVDLAAMQEALTKSDNPEDGLHLHYALGKAFEDRAEYENSFLHYAEGARLRRLHTPYDPARTAHHVSASKRLMTADTFATRHGQGLPDPAPIFVVGLPRAGSTLVEQILASHSLVEGTMELPEIGAIARDLSTSQNPEEGGYLAALLAKGPADLAALGTRYIENVRIQRKTGRPFFIDKMPNNFEHVGMIHLILPNARIIDVRRHPMASCFSAFKQHFSRGQNFSYSLDDLGKYYRDYVSLMDHYDAVLPNRVHRVYYERLVDDPESEIRALLAHCGLDFEAACLEFHKTDRPVRTASSEQVRRPITASAVDHWRHYEPWLGPLKSVLGATINMHMTAKKQP